MDGFPCDILTCPSKLKGNLSTICNNPLFPCEGQFGTNSQNVMFEHFLFIFLNYSLCLSHHVSIFIPFISPSFVHPLPLQTPPPHTNTIKLKRKRKGQQENLILSGKLQCDTVSQAVNPFTHNSLLESVQSLQRVIGLV